LLTRANIEVTGLHAASARSIAPKDTLNISAAVTRLNFFDGLELIPRSQVTFAARGRFSSASRRPMRMTLGCAHASFAPVNT
jgi:hypothetical protein